MAAATWQVFSTSLSPPPPLYPSLSLFLRLAISHKIILYFYMRQLTLIRFDSPLCCPPPGQLSLSLCYCCVSAFVCLSIFIYSRARKAKKSLFSLSSCDARATLSVYRRQNSFYCSKIISVAQREMERERGSGERGRGRHNQFPLETVRASIKVKRGKVKRGSRKKAKCKFIWLVGGRGRGNRGRGGNVF